MNRKLDGSRFTFFSPDFRPLGLTSYQATVRYHYNMADNPFDGGFFRASFRHDIQPGIGDLLQFFAS
jgi:hypothetical protein